MAKIAAGSNVMVVASIIPSLFRDAPPVWGVCESATDPGGVDPPTSVVVDFEDGTRVTYASSDGLSQALGPSEPSAVGKTASFIAPFPNPGSRTQGPVVAHFGFANAQGTSSAADWLVVRTPIGYLTVPYAVADLRG